jgi:hypothetical protein
VATGLVLDPQLIFEGKTPKCLPKSPAPPGMVFDYSSSHWQTPETMIRYTNKILIPYKDRVIAAKGLRHVQKMILKLDLHYSHKDKLFIEHCTKNNIILLYVPARCTDELQECDLIGNSNWKTGLRAGFKVYMNKLFDAYLAEGKDPALFKPSFKMSVIKPALPGFVVVAHAALAHPDMMSAIKKCFYEKGCLGLMRSPEMIILARHELEEEELAGALLV